ncbi:phenoloxidase-activating factor 2 isoform X1 [Nasonia vitripennis]|uniref:Peptidase S1 domain-containing protein n=1 Tax=Nasonia vitripennis TaxID=7425 RepID=A0A7M7IXN2_NASVI|nr:phenoloxidase-activating factor 2 isoform X1 [Nasonia vitripennis]
MFRLTVILAVCCHWTGVRGQFENGIVFTNGDNSIGTVYPTQSAAIRQATTIANQKCMCVLAGTCPTGGNGIDIRIVNNGPTQTPCPAGYVSCCSPGNQNQVDGTCGIRKITPTQQPVVGQASFGAYPWQAALLNSQQAYLGSGVLLDATHVLTAAHKVAAFVNNPTGMLVRLGEWNARSNSEPLDPVTVNVVRITLHPQFNANNLENDLAIITLNGYVNIPSYANVNTACKPTTAPVTGRRCYVAGWGKNLFGPNGSYQSILKEVDVPILDNTDCENRLKQTRLGAAFVLNRVSFMCAGGEAGKDACTGDGGAPLVCQKASGQWEVVGIVAWGIGCATPGVPGVYTNVFNFLPWINTVVATL